jgi:hypothetical protein
MATSRLCGARRCSNQIDALPSSQGEPSAHDRNAELYAGQRRSDMGWHIVIAFVGMPIPPRLLRRRAFKECLEIRADLRRGVLLNEQPGGSVPAEQGQQPGLHPTGPQPTRNIVRNLDKASARGRNPKYVGELMHVGCPPLFSKELCTREHLDDFGVVGSPHLRPS